MRPESKLRKAEAPIQKGQRPGGAHESAARLLDSFRRVASTPMSNSLTLAAEEVAAMTRRDRPTAQARVLRALGIPYREHPTDHALIVSRAAAEEALGARLHSAAPATPAIYDVDVEAIRIHGKTARPY